MQKKYTIAFIIILLLVGGFLVFSMGNKAEAPISPTTDPLNGTQTESSPTGGGTNTGNVSTNPIANPIPEGVVCTMDAKLCPDGSAVGRGGPNCEFAACPSASTQKVKEFTVSATNFSFTPSLLTVQKGDRVKVTFQNTLGFHDFVIDEYGVATPQTQSPTTSMVEFTADKAGSFEYYCSVGTHRAMGMKGTLKVE